MSSPAPQPAKNRVRTLSGGNAPLCGPGEQDAQSRPAQRVRNCSLPVAGTERIDLTSAFRI